MGIKVAKRKILDKSYKDVLCNVLIHATFLKAEIVSKQEIKNCMLLET